MVEGKGCWHSVFAHPWLPAPCSLPAMVEAAWDLHTRLQALSPPADGNGATAAGAAAAAAAAAGGGEGEAGEARLPSAMAGMSVVSAQRQRLHGVQRSFVDKASSYLQEEFGRIAEPALQQVVALQGAQRKRPVEHGSLRRRAAELAPLLEVVGVLRPAATVAPREAYCQAVNALLRREVHAAASEAKRSAAAADAGGTHEPDLFDRAAATDSARWVCLGARAGRESRCWSLPRAGQGQGKIVPAVREI